MNFLIKSKLILLLIIVSLANADQIKPAKAEIQTPSNIQQPNSKKAYKQQDIASSYKLIQNQQANSQKSYSENLALVNLDQYNLATYVFSTQQYFPFCDRCKRLQYFAFRVGSYYLTAKSTFLRLELSSSPTNYQLFVAEQQIDGTWAFKSLAYGKYLRASNDGTTIDYQTYVGPWQRWYIQRHGNHVHIQSARWAYNWWIFDSLVLKQLNGGASALVVEYWPQLQWLWNW